MKRVLFVCTGNTCRSPMAEALLRHYSKGAWKVKSAGVYASVGSDASSHTKTVLGEKGIVMSHTSQQVTEELLHWSDVILTMTSSHQQALLQYHPEMKGKVYTLYEYAEGINKDVSDPYGGTLQVYEDTLSEMEKLIKTLLEKHSDS